MTSPSTESNQEDLIAFVTDPDTIKKAAEGSMDKRAKVLYGDNQELLREAILKFDLARSKSTRNYIKGLITEQEADDALIQDVADLLDVFNSELVLAQQEAELNGRVQVYRVVTDNWNRTNFKVLMQDIYDYDLKLLRELKANPTTQKGEDHHE